MNNLKTSIEIPKMLFHGTNSNFTEFDENFIRYVGANGDGFYFTPDKHYAKTYGENIKKCELDIKNPIYPGIKFLNKSHYKKLLKELFNDEEYKDDLKNYGFFNDNDFESFAEAKAEELHNKNDDYEAIFDLVNTAVGSVRVVAEKLRKCTGIYFDAVVSVGMGEYVVFKSNQITIL